MLALRTIIVVSALSFSCFFSILQAKGSTNSSIEMGLLSLSHGDYVLAAERLEQVTHAATRSGDVKLQVLAGIYLSDVRRAQGRLIESIDILESLRPLSEDQNDPRSAASVYGRLGASYTRVGKIDRANAFIDRGILIAKSAGDDDLLASLLNDQGNLLVLNGNLEFAESNFRQSVAAAARSGSNQVEASARNNLVRTLLVRYDGNRVAALLKENFRQTKTLPDSVNKIQLLLSIGTLLQQAQEKPPSSSDLRALSYAALREGLSLAQQLNNPRLESYALGYIGRLYEEEGRLEEALSYTNRALFIAQGITAYDSLYLWEWQSARLLRKKGQRNKALIAYKQSINSLQKIRASLIYSTYGGFRRKVGPVFTEYADLLIKQIPDIEDPSTVQDLLVEVRLTLEQSKVAEVEAYFQDECVVTAQSIANLDRVAPGVAVIYPLLLADRTEILVSLPDGIRQYTSKVGKQTLNTLVSQLRDGLESVGEQHEYRAYAQELYHWLLKPMEAELKLHNIDTLVFVPDGPLRSVPFSALHDGDAFLIEHYAIATTPGLTIVNPQPIAWDGVKILLSGITEPRPGFVQLPYVGEELDGIRASFPDSTTLKDKDFVLQNVRSAMAEGNYPIVHFATHARFSGDHRKSFLLAYDGKLTMQRLSETIRARRYQEEPIELLVLSACQTAAGNERAALGLAGVAIQAGAHSALASLWLIEDEASAYLIDKFYCHLKSRTVTKAGALRQAQLSLLRSENMQHPAYWAPFLLIGNWL